MPVEERARAIGVFHTITDELFLSAVHNEYCVNYVVANGDSYDRIAKRHKISKNLLYDLNNRPRDAKMLHPGDNLKVPKGEPRLVVRKRDFTASLYFGDYLVRQYREAYERFFCPVCDYPIRRGPLKFVFWSRRTIKHLHFPPQTPPLADEPYTCPACGTLLFEKCAVCGNVRHSLLPICSHCGSAKDVAAAPAKS